MTPYAVGQSSTALRAAHNVTLGTESDPCFPHLHPNLPESLEMRRAPPRDGPSGQALPPSAGSARHARSDRWRNLLLESQTSVLQRIADEKVDVITPVGRTDQRARFPAVSNTRRRWQQRRSWRQRVLRRWRGCGGSTAGKKSLIRGAAPYPLRLTLPRPEVYH